MLSGIERVRACKAWALAAWALKCFAMTSGIVTQWPRLVDVDQLEVRS
jgi:hypothetical protein